MEGINELQSEISRAISGESYFDNITKHIYSVDASIYEKIPTAIVVPKSTQDIIATVKIASKHGLPITARGAATGITGGCLGNGIIIDTSKYLNKILEVNYEKEYAVCEPGVIQDQLNEYLEPRGYRLGPDTSTGNRATIGGMLGNNAAGARSLYYGKMIDHVLEIEMVLANGDSLTFRELSESQLKEICQSNNFEGRIYNEILKIRENYREDIRNSFPNIPRRVSGYNLDELIKSNDLNLTKLIVGSEGTLGIVTKIKVKICKRPQNTAFCLLFFENMIEGMRSLNDILSYSPLSVEMIDNKIIAMGKQSPTMQGKTDWLIGNPEAIFVVEFQESTKAALISLVENFADRMEHDKVGYKRSVIYDNNTIAHVWSMRKAGLGLLLSKRTYSRAIAFIEDITVAPQNLATFMEKFQSILSKYKKEAGVYGHVGSGCMHIRPYINLRDTEEIDCMKAIMLEVTELLIESRGSLSGEHGDGYIRTWLNKKLFGDSLYQAFVDVKKAFDPNGLMNPNKIVDGLPVEKDLRIDSNTKQHKIKTFLDFTKEGGFELSVDLCNGNAQCRKPEGLMCPSFQVSGDEHDSTRGRAQVLRSIINGKLPSKEFTGKGLYDVLDLCVECKGCKAECPSQVDMAKMKSEFLYHYYKKNSSPVRNKLFGYIGSINKFCSRFSRLTNWILRSVLNKKLMSILGITTKREFPLLAKQRFSSWTKSVAPTHKRDKDVVLFIDTFTEYNYPQIGIAAHKVLSSLGYKVIVNTPKCCGRPMISKGMLEQAKANAEEILNQLIPYAENDTQIVILEPSCLSAITDDYHFLVGESHKIIETVSENCTSLENFVLENLSLVNWITNDEIEIHFHRHCHQKALTKKEALGTLLNQIPKSVVHEIPSGCCGVAGSFGYEKEHYDFSLKIGELHLLPYIRALDEKAIIIANGVSCRNQIIHGTGRKAVHIAELLSKYLKN
ncbi:MAG: FAD-linked oxidase C-terminal domain-containing protein [Chlamydiota bacterium]|nr:FAD-linked oxidase C-terminal domain-containing protein [Chlamydiota bacterium]